VLNLTPDSFSDGGEIQDKSSAIDKANNLAESGAHIIEIGGEATGPKSTPISSELELERIVPALSEISKTHFVSVDTYKSETAARCLELGARMINDVSALRADADMGAVVKEHNAYLAIMYSKEPQLPHVSTSVVKYKDIVKEIAEFLLRRIDFALGLGIKQDLLIVDPGMGHYLSYNEPHWSWELLESLDRLRDYGVSLPIMLGTSRKSFLGGKLSERDPASALTAAMAVSNGAALIRTHNPRLSSEFIEIFRKMNFLKKK